MQRVLESPGRAFAGSETRAAPASSSPSVTVPAENSLRGFPVVAENAENVPAPAARPPAPSTSALRMILRARDIKAARSRARSRLVVARFPGERVGARGEPLGVVVVLERRTDPVGHRVGLAPGGAARPVGQREA